MAAVSAGAVPISAGAANLAGAGARGMTDGSPPAPGAAPSPGRRAGRSPIGTPGVISLNWARALSLRLRHTVSRARHNFGLSSSGYTARMSPWVGG
eukprot:scaffold27867_cov120-Isochrysis_galbana.AAC.8